MVVSVHLTKIQKLLYYFNGNTHILVVTQSKDLYTSVASSFELTHLTDSQC